tara:strand:+ start:64909 stop:65136 length:228 start_codon:yes stop_codon:yes gene_type:complete
LLFGAANVSGIAAGFALAQAFELFGNAGLQLAALGEQQRAEELLLRGIHVVICRLGEQFGVGKRRFGHRQDSLAL